MVLSKRRTAAQEEAFVANEVFAGVATRKMLCYNLRFARIGGWLSEKGGVSKLKG
jgi:hypothetical protein